MASTSSNLPAIEKALNGLANSCDLTRGGLGKDLLDIVAVGILDRSLGRQSAPDGTPWAPNQADYAARKQGRPIGVLTGQMLSQVEVSGERAIEPGSATMTYGVSSDARDKAGWFQDGRQDAQPARPFFDIDDEIEAKIDKYLDDYAADVLKRL